MSSFTRSSTGINPSRLIESRVYQIRGQKVLIDSDLADLYQVSMKTLNLAVRRHHQRFPEDFMFQLDAAETETLTPVAKKRRTLPTVFTERGTAMLSCVLHSEMALQVSLAIMNAFVMNRQQAGQNQAPDQADGPIEYVFSTLDQLIAPTPGTSRRAMGVFAARAGAMNEY